MKQLFLSVETLSDVSPKNAGVYRYSESPSFITTLIAAAIDDMPIQVFDLYHKESLPSEIVQALTDPDCKKFAFDARFTRVCLSRFLGMPIGTYLPPEQWRCLRSEALYNGMPDKILLLGGMQGIPDCINDEMTGYLRKSCSDLLKKNRLDELQYEWPLYKEYLLRKVNNARSLSKILDRYVILEFEQQLYYACERINDRGIMVDTRMIDNAIQIDERQQSERFV